MKIKSDFVTNSSSSSFVLAVQDDTTVEKIIEFFNTEEMNKIFENVWGELEYFDCDSQTIEEFKVEVARHCLNPGRYVEPMKLDKWNVYTFYASNEDDMLSNFFYNASFDTDFLKGKGEC